MRRTALKWLHWLALAFLLYFFLIEPGDVSRAAPEVAKTAALSTHAGVGVLLAILSAIWTLMYWAKGQTGRPGPKLSPLARKIHYWGHRALYWALPLMLLTGAAAGLAAPFPVLGFGVIPLNFGGNMTLHNIIVDIHEFAFDALTILIVTHSIFHVWRHYVLKDNALRMMVPKALHGRI